LATIGLSKGFKHGNLCGNLYSHCILKINEKLMRTDANNDNEVSNTIDNKAKLEISKALLYHLIFELIPGTISFFIKNFSLLIIIIIEKQNVDNDILSQIKDVIISIDQDLLVTYETFLSSLSNELVDN
jgi:hypothetical protein